MNESSRAKKPGNSDTKILHFDLKPEDALQTWKFRIAL